MPARRATKLLTAAVV